MAGSYAAACLFVEDLRLCSIIEWLKGIHSLTIIAGCGLAVFSSISNGRLRLPWWW